MVLSGEPSFFSPSRRSCPLLLQANSGGRGGSVPKRLRKGESDSEGGESDAVGDEEDADPDVDHSLLPKLMGLLSCP